MHDRNDSKSVRKSARNNDSDIKRPKLHVKIEDSARKKSTEHVTSPGHSKIQFFNQSNNMSKNRK